MPSRKKGQPQNQRPHKRKNKPEEVNSDSQGIPEPEEPFPVSQRMPSALRVDDQQGLFQMCVHPLFLPITF
ncbi:hypothetical protein BJX63DRAFT_57439 [Aspergillus granulosus]|uniref:Uncharacterized protein n=1 Tax=Aspergillus granulosus TaxID=176169 RepID=A0ABR4GX88_9EURO